MFGVFFARRGHEQAQEQGLCKPLQPKRDKAHGAVRRLKNYKQDALAQGSEARHVGAHSNVKGGGKSS